MTEFADNSQTLETEIGSIEAELRKHLGAHEAIEFMPIFEMCCDISKSYSSSKGTKEARKKLRQLEDALDKASRLLGEMDDTDMLLLESDAGSPVLVYKEIKNLRKALFRMGARVSRGSDADVPRRTEWEATHLLLLYLTEAWERVKREHPPVSCPPHTKPHAFWDLASQCVRAATRYPLSERQYIKFFKTHKSKRA